MKQDISQAVRRYQFPSQEIGKLFNLQIKFQDPEVVLNVHTDKPNDRTPKLSVENLLRYRERFAAT
jgi:hypothetical protein